MYSISFNILSNNIVLNKVPYMFISDDHSKIINEIRQILKDIIKSQYEKYNVEFSEETFNLSLCIWSKEPSNIHICEIKCSNVKEVKTVIIEENAKIMHKRIMGDIL